MAFGPIVLEEGMRVQISAVALLLSAVFGAVTPLSAQSLADVAKKEEERRKTVKDTAKVYTNKDLQGGSDTVVGTPADSSGTAAASTAAPDATTPAPGAPKETAKPVAPLDPSADASLAKGQEYWSGRMKALQTSLDRDQTYVEALQSRINALTTDFVNRDDPAQRTQIGLDRQRATDELNRLKKAIVDGKKAIVDLEDEARRAAVPAGWLR
jgi:hypothetical protein